jgi:hypothetical protein
MLAATARVDLRRAFLHAARMTGIHISHFPATRSGSSAPGEPGLSSSTKRKPVTNDTAAASGGNHNRVASPPSPTTTRSLTSCSPSSLVKVAETGQHPRNWKAIILRISENASAS